MSRVPAGETLELYQGGTLDETWDFNEPDGTPTDFTGYSAELRIAKDTETAAMLVVLSGGTAPPDASALVFGAGTLRIYLTDEATAALTEANFGRGGNRRDGYTYNGICTLLFTNGASETTVENLGPVVFHPIAEAAA